MFKDKNQKTYQSNVVESSRVCLKRGFIPALHGKTTAMNILMMRLIGFRGDLLQVPFWQNMVVFLNDTNLINLINPCFTISNTLDQPTQEHWHFGTSGACARKTPIWDLQTLDEKYRSQTLNVWYEFTSPFFYILPTQRQ